jgi:hypothetical protein
MRVRIGQVTGNSSATLRIPRNVVVGGQVQLMADPVGSRATYISDIITVDSDQQIQLTIAPSINMSTYALRMR